MRSPLEEDFLKAIYALESNSLEASTNAIAKQLEMKASNVSDMLKKLSEKDLVHYKKYKGASLKKTGKTIALSVVRRHRLWETFLVNELYFKWDEVHELAEQLEHIKSIELINRLDDFLGNPKFDPHGDPIPDKKGNIKDGRHSSYLSDLKIGNRSVIIGVKDSSAHLLQYLEKEGMILGTEIIIHEIHDFDNSLKIKLNHREINISEKIAQNILVQLSC